MIENGIIRSPDENELKKANQFYRITGKVDGSNYTYVIIDYDKTKIRPFVKDILNRQEMFIEIKLLYRVILFIGVIFLSTSIFFILSPGKAFISSSLTTETQKIINACQTSSNLSKSSLTNDLQTFPIQSKRQYGN
jgi:hypothetical protein